LFETQLGEVGNYGNIASVKKKTPLTLLVSLESHWKSNLDGDSYYEVCQLHRQNYAIKMLFTEIVRTIREVGFSVTTILLYNACNTCKELFFGICIYIDAVFLPY